uniref:Uncharacterized protein n=1 Tax=Timema poppense TaxID=170557 RepID=A0A7R9H1R1_TIMPO|nr:unnamed protein product [Timema poppensis]
MDLTPTKPCYCPEVRFNLAEWRNRVENTGTCGDPTKRKVDNNLGKYTIIHPAEIRALTLLLAENQTEDECYICSCACWQGVGVVWDKNFKSLKEEVMSDDVCIDEYYGNTDFQLTNNSRLKESPQWTYSLRRHSRSRLKCRGRGSLAYSSMTTCFGVTIDVTPSSGLRKTNYTHKVVSISTAPENYKTRVGTLSRLTNAALVAYHATAPSDSAGDAALYRPELSIQLTENSTRSTYRHSEHIYCTKMVTTMLTTDRPDRRK